MNGGSKTISRGVANTDSILLGLELGDRANRAEDFLLHDLHVFRHIAKDGRLDEVALVTFALTADFDLCAGLLASLDVAAWN